MALQIVKQPSNAYSIWSTVSQAFITTGATRQEIIDWMVSDMAKKAEKNANDILNALDQGQAPYGPGTVSWSECCIQANKNHQITKRVEHGRPN